MPKKPRKVSTVATIEQPQRNCVQAIHETEIAKVSTLKDLRKATHHTQDDLAIAMGVGQGTVSRIEKRHDMLVSTLQHYVEGVGGTLQLLAVFPNRPPLIVERLGKKAALSLQDNTTECPGSSPTADP